MCGIERHTRQAGWRPIRLSTEERSCATAGWTTASTFSSGSARFGKRRCESRRAAVAPLNPSLVARLSILKAGLAQASTEPPLEGGSIGSSEHRPIGNHSDGIENVRVVERPRRERSRVLAIRMPLT